ncbi:pyridoxal phosphate-dependent aminotransferase [Oceanibacterium hippocampi]|uniref:Aminotransferase n=1 Tax=Oceanibacterium hippocampi TaxID=745714 RepID=A0A1Y5RY50_9PROT|nr:pyridoxal phosphate-dependent aminotransferase [Oceanibacterium hippocampi]SLN28061.1 Aspartate aminotransferase [Oceanibacterium hippocampi]
MRGIRDVIAGMEIQKIGEVSKLALDYPDTMPLWFGESDMATPEFVQAAAIAAMRAGHTRYVNKRGLPALRHAIAAYNEALFGRPVALERVTATASAMTAIMIAMQCLVGNGDNVVMVSPVWPNAVQCVTAMGGESRHVRLRDGEGGWQLDLDELFAACDERTRAFFIASPGNPTGWVMSPEEQRAILDFCRARGIWLIADEVYNRIVYDAPRNGFAHAPSMMEMIEPDDPVFVVYGFSKAYAMTGWRLGWLVHPPALGAAIGDLSGINNTGATSFVQHAGVAALGTEGEAFLATMIERCRVGREIVFQRLAALPGVRISRPEAAFYAFFAVDGIDDSLAFAQDLVRRHGVGLSPGSAFGPGNESCLRLCFANSEAVLSDALDRLTAALGRA